jgi:polyribonucleotide nucleotidyltransferase
LIGPGGKVIQELQKTTGTTIVINEDPITEEGVIEILGTDPAGIEAVLAKIKSITFKPQMNVAYEVKVIKMLDFGAVVEYQLQEMKYYFTYLNLHGNVQKMFLTL